jgi:hypothetical protein
VPDSVALLALGLQPLAALARWTTVAIELSALADALRGNEGISPEQVARLRLWSLRWQRLHPRLREWYASSAHIDERIGAALFHILSGRRARIGVIVAAKHAYHETTGRDPHIDLVPHIV